MSHCLASRALLRYGGRVDQRHLGGTPLHHAVRAGFVQTMPVLLDNGADGAALDDRVRTPEDQPNAPRHKWTSLRYPERWVECDKEKCRPAVNGSTVACATVT